MTRLDDRAFRYLLFMFTEIYHRYTPYGDDGQIRRLSESTRGRPRSLAPTSCLALKLTWFRTRGSCFTLCMLFGITSSVCNLFFRFSRRILMRVLCTDSLSKVCMPTEDEIILHKCLNEEPYPLLRGVYAVADRLKLYLEQSSDAVIQNMFYNGWTHDHYVI